MSVIQRTFKPLNNFNHRFQAFFEIVNQQRIPDNQNFLTENRTWLTKVYRFKHFNDFLKDELRSEITKRIIDNGMTGSRWFFKRFDRINVIVLPLTANAKSITS